MGFLALKTEMDPPKKGVMGRRQNRTFGKQKDSITTAQDMRCLLEDWLRESFAYLNKKKRGGADDTFTSLEVK